MKNVLLCITCKAPATELVKGIKSNKVFPHCETCKEGILEDHPDLFRELTRLELIELAARE